jgi:hypothetical protein
VIGHEASPVHIFYREHSAQIAEASLRVHLAYAQEDGERGKLPLEKGERFLGVISLGYITGVR